MCMQNFTVKFSMLGSEMELATDDVALLAECCCQAATAAVMPLLPHVFACLWPPQPHRWTLHKVWASIALHHIHVQDWQQQFESPRLHV
jgi:hypothetical protein